MNVRKVMRRRVVAALLVIYLIIGVIVASGHQYFEHLNSLKLIVSAVLGVLLWPLVLLGLSLHFK